ncbi:MAG: hypothetical protein IKU12_01865 [Oscillospiraceae bacterium]|nr:hypothetical protein [Oscillospiraceae bacterium]
MKNEDIFRAIGDAADAHIEDTANAITQKRRSRLPYFAAAAACLCLMAVGTMIPGRDSNSTTGEDIAIEDAAYSITLSSSSATYFPISFEERRTYGLVDENAVGLTAENTYQITENDLGEPMGSVTESLDESLIGCAVYHFAAFPELESICIVERGGSYEFYTTTGPILVFITEGRSSATLDAYVLPQQAEKVTVQDGSWEELLTITDKNAIAALCGILADKEDMGLAAHEQRYADLWKEVMGNEDVYYKEGFGMAYTNGRTPDDTSPIWHKDQRIVTIYAENGFSLEFIYNPAIATFCWGDEYFPLTQEEVTAINEIIGIA